MQICRLPRGPQAERRRPPGVAGRRPVRPLHHRRRGTRPQPHHDLAPHRRTRGVDRWPGAGPCRGRLGADRSGARGIGGRRGGGIRGAVDHHRFAWRSRPRRRCADLGDRRFQRVHRRTRGSAGAAQASEGRRGDRCGDPAGHPAAVRPRHRGGGRRTAGASRGGDPSRRLLPGVVRRARLPG